MKDRQSARYVVSRQNHCLRIAAGCVVRTVTEWEDNDNCNALYLLTYCQICGERIEKMVHGRCGTCDQYLRVTGVERTGLLLGLTEHKRPKRLPKDHRCTNCNKSREEFSSRSFTYGRCESCWHYFDKYGKERPEDAKTTNHLPKDHRCTNCGKGRDELGPYSFAHGRCGLCANYFKRTGKERPEDLYRKPNGQARFVYPEDHRCTNCNKSKDELVTPEFQRGRCCACYSHFVKHGTEKDV